MRLTVQISDGKRSTMKFSHANLGHLFRLRGRYREAEQEYLRALGPHPRRSRVTNGLNELSRLFVEMGWEADG